MKDQTTKPMTVRKLRGLLHKFDDGVLMHGGHDENEGKFCALEFESKVRGRYFSDEPITLPDVRPVNDGVWLSDKSRTDALLPVLAALWGWENWTKSKRRRWVREASLEIARKVIPAIQNLDSTATNSLKSLKSLRDIKRLLATVEKELDDSGDSALYDLQEQLKDIFDSAAPAYADSMLGMVVRMSEYGQTKAEQEKILAACCKAMVAAAKQLE